MHARHRRALRGVAAAAAATTTAAAAHTLAGGGAPEPMLVAAVTILAAPLAVVLAGRRLSLWRTALTVVAAQLVLHVAFAITAGLDPSAGVGHAHHGVMGVGPSAVVMIPDAAMSLAHLAAAAVTVVILYRGERMLRALGRGIAHVFAPCREVALSSHPAAPPVAVEPAVEPAARTLFSDISRRGPPAVVAAV